MAVMQRSQIDDVPEEFISKDLKDLFHPEVLSKCDTFVVAVSGCPAENRDYMFFTGLRNDRERNSQVNDLDPTGMVYDLSTESPAPSGIVVFHGDFEGRTEENYSISSKHVGEFKEEIKNKWIPFEEAPKRFTNAMHYVAKKYRDKIDQP